MLNAFAFKKEKVKTFKNADNNIEGIISMLGCGHALRAVVVPVLLNGSICFHPGRRKCCWNTINDKQQKQTVE